MIRFAVFVIALFIFGAFALAFTWHKRFEPDDDSKDSHDNWNDV